MFHFLHGSLFIFGFNHFKKRKECLIELIGFSENLEGLMKPHRLVLYAQIISFSFN